MVFGTVVGLELAYCCCVIGRVCDVTYGVWYCGGTGIGLIAVVL